VLLGRYGRAANNYEDPLSFYFNLEQVRCSDNATTMCCCSKLLTHNRHLKEQFKNDLIYYFTNCRYSDCLSLTCATNNSKTILKNLKKRKGKEKRKKKRIMLQKTEKNGNIQGKYKVLMLWGSHKKK